MARLSIVLLVVAQLGEVSINAVRVVNKKSAKAEECCCKPMEEETMCTEGKWQACVAFQKDKPQCCQTTSSCEGPQKTDKKLCGLELKLSPKEPLEVDEKGEEDPLELLTFFDTIKDDVNSKADQLTRDYTIIVDRSGSMMGTEEVDVPEKIAEKYSKVNAGSNIMSLWDQAEAALVFLADAAVEQDPDGISLIMFDYEADETEDVQTAAEVMKLFKANPPRRGRTHLDLALALAVEPDTVGRAETILVITDGAPDSGGGARDPIRGNVENIIVKAARQLCRDEDLSISFIQVGSDSGDAKDSQGIPMHADQYLEYLDDELQKKHNIYDIVDTMSKSKMDGKTFLQVVVAGIED